MAVLMRLPNNQSVTQHQQNRTPSAKMSKSINNSRNCLKFSTFLTDIEENPWTVRHYLKPSGEMGPSGV